MASLRKPVIVRKFTREWIAGYAGAGFDRHAPALELLDTGGKVISIAWDAVKWVCFVRELAIGDLNQPERLLQKRFTVRPRTPGLWLRMNLMDGEELEGLAANDRTLVDGHGLMLIPPDTRSNTQRIFVPRQAIQTLEVLALIGAPRRRQTDAGRTAEQPELFPAESAGES